MYNHKIFEKKFNSIILSHGCSIPNAGAHEICETLGTCNISMMVALLLDNYLTYSVRKIPFTIFDAILCLKIF